MRLYFLVGIALSTAACSSGSSGGGGNAGDASTGGDGALSCGFNNPGGVDNGVAYNTYQSEACQCDNAFVGGDGGVGDTCQNDSNCPAFCCPCPNGHGNFSASVCHASSPTATSGTCADQTSACSLVWGVGFAQTHLCN